MKHIRFIILLVFFQVSLTVCAQDIAATSVQYSNSELVEAKGPGKKKTKSPEQKRRNTVKIYDVVGTIIMCILDGLTEGALYYNRH